MTSAALAAEVNAVGAILPGGAFFFGVANNSGTIIAKAANDDGGRVTFPEIDLPAPGDYVYIIQALGANAEGWELNSPIYPAIIRVRERLRGLISATEYPKGFPTFTAEYRPAGEALAVFPAIIIKEPGKYEYIIKEKAPEDPDYTTDERTYRLRLDVEKNETGNLICSANYPDGFPLFENKYNDPIITPRAPIIPQEAPEEPPEQVTPNAKIDPKIPAPPTPPAIPPTEEQSIQVKIRAHNWICGTNNPHEGEFTFGLFDSRNEIIEETENDLDGTVEFELTFDAPEKRRFYIKQTTILKRFEIDRSVWPVEITVTKASQKRLTAEVYYPNGYPEFINYFNK